MLQGALVTLAPWQPQSGYLSTASFGIPCPAAVEAVTAVTAAWAQGRLTFGSWFAQTQAVRESVARLLDVPADSVALGTSTATMVGSVAANLPDRACVLAPENEHSSNLLPFRNHAHRGVSIKLVPLNELADHVDDSIALVSCSAVQSLTGEVADIAAIRRATQRSGTKFSLDASQACGWLPLFGAAADYIVCSVYKWLCSPIGGAFLVVSADAARAMRPAVPGWPATAEPAGPPYGVDSPWATDSHRFDSAPNLISMIGARPAIDAIASIGVETVFKHNVALANTLRDGLDMPPSNSAIVTLPMPGGAAQLASAGLSATEWRGVLRLSFHLYNTDEDVSRALAALKSIRR
jgi:selenocysteine lyase/cysteine desulfurase